MLSMRSAIMSGHHSSRGAGTGSWKPNRSPGLKSLSIIGAARRFAWVMQLPPCSMLVRAAVDDVPLQLLDARLARRVVAPATTAAAVAGEVEMELHGPAAIRQRGDFVLHAAASLAAGDDA